ncbi:MAG: hypothetical protein IK005_06425 [Paludibacteraceae bacterium]|nr:hypothetical protein [Paludibacteraceae bacterium]MBR4840095.1 hypothetical protein [Paludibacteraceae bacterium]
MRIVFKSLLIVASILMAYMCYSSIMTPIEFNEKKAQRDNAVIQRLKDIRKAQVQYKELHGKYTASFDTLIYFINNEQIPVVMKLGELTDHQLEKGLTDSIALKLSTPEEAAKYDIEDLDQFLANFRRDTSYVSVKKSLFGENYPGLDSLAYVPFTNGQKFEMATGEYVTKSNTKIPLFEAKVPYKVYLNGLNNQEIINLVKQAETLGRYEGLKVGDIYESNNNAGNWE